MSVKSTTPNLPTGWKTIVGVVANTPSHEEKLQKFLLRVRDEYVLVFAPKEVLVAAGDMVSVTGELERIVEYSNSSRSAASFWKRRGVNYSLNVAYSGYFEALSFGRGVFNWGSLWFYDTWVRLKRHLPEREAGATIGMLAGQQGLVDKELIEKMQRAGTFHMLSTSGANVLIISGAMFLLLSHLPIPRTALVVIILFALLTYMGGVGGRPPVVRATMMVFVMLISSAFGKSPDGLSAWAAAGIGYAVYEPGAIWDLGFQLTFMIVLLLLLFLPHAVIFVKRAAKRFAMKGLGVVCVWLFTAVMTTIIAQMAAAPLLMMNFGNVSLMAPLANLLTAPFIPFLYLGNLLAQITAPFSESLSYGFDRLITGSFASWIVFVSDVLGSFSWSAITTSALPGSLAVIYFLGVILLSRPVIIPPSFWEETQ